MIPRPSFNGPEPEKDHRPSGPAEGDPPFHFSAPVAQPSRYLDWREWFSGQLQGLLEMVSPTRKGKAVQIDGFRILDEPEINVSFQHPSGTEKAPPGNLLDIYEPRIPYIRRLLEMLLSVVDLEQMGEKVVIDGFRLKHPEQWLKAGGGASDLLAQAATRCNLRCRYCYNLGSPALFQTESQPAEEEYEELSARIAWYVPGSKLGLSPVSGSLCEMLAHPRILDIMAVLRGKTSEVFRLPTNGSLLTPEMLRDLQALRPLFVDVSLNSSSPVRRQWLMRDPEPERAIKALAGLEQARIPYSVVIVPWPFPTMEEMVRDLIQTVKFAARFHPAFIQISLPGYSRRFSPDPLFEHEKVWGRVKEEILNLRSGTECPLILRPGLFEEYQTPEAVDQPRVIGVVPHSPAARAGVLPGDVIRAVKGLKVRNRPQALSLLKMIHNSDLEKCQITIERSESLLNLTMGPMGFHFPYDPLSIPFLGCIFPSTGIPLDWGEKIRKLVSENQAREVLVLTSTLIKPVLERRVLETPLPEEVHLYLRIPANRYLGGNIFMGDLLVVEDFIEEVRSFIREGRTLPDLILIPSSPFHLSGWGRDLTGRVYKDIEKVTGIPVVLVECDPIFD
ncbi:MAG: radical SAM protein [Thermodesulfobacteriota bacterium]